MLHQNPSNSDNPFAAEQLEEMFLVLVSVKRLSHLQGHSAEGRFMSMKNSNETTGNRTLDFPACRVVLLTYLLTPWSRVLLEKLTGSAASQEIPRISY